MNPTEALKYIIIHYRRKILNNHRQVEAMLHDLCNNPNFRRDVNILILALKENIPNELIYNQTISDLLIVHLIKRLDDAYFIPSQKAYISIEVWAKVLNISLPKVTNINNFLQVGKK